MSAEATSIAWYLRRATPEPLRSAVDWPAGTRSAIPSDYVDRIATRDLASVHEELERAGGASLPAKAGVDAATQPGSALPLLLRACVDVNGVFDAAVLFWRVLSSSRLERRDLDAGAELVIVDEWRDRRRGHDLLTSYFVGLLVGALRHAGVTPTEIRMPGEVTLTNGSSYSVFGAQAIHGADLARVRVSRADLARPLVTADEHVASYLRADLARGLERLQMAVSWRIDELIRTSLDDGLGMRGAAKTLGLSERTLRRRLDDEGTSFRERLDHVRRSRALELLAHEDVAPVARCLGFVDARSFQRAFRRWTGMTPLEYKRATSGRRPAVAFG